MCAAIHCVLWFYRYLVASHKRLFYLLLLDSFPSSDFSYPWILLFCLFQISFTCVFFLLVFFTTAMMIMSLDRGGGLSDRGQTDGRTVHCGSLILILMHPPIKKGIVGCWCLYWGHPTNNKKNLHCANRLGIPHVKKCIWNVDYIIFFFIYVMWN